MGIFSGGFGSGLATGLATSVSKSLTDAMDRREEELSKARVFWQTRQAQKQDTVDAENKRIEKAYKRITNEMGGDAAKGLAAYQAIGGNIDDVERYITVLNKTQEANMDYSLQDQLDFDGLNLGDYGDFTYDKGFDSIKSVVTAADVNYVEAPSILTAIGLGQDTEKVGKSLQQQVDQLIPRSERTDAGIGAAKIKGSLYEGMSSAQEDIELDKLLTRYYQQREKYPVNSEEYRKFDTKIENLLKLQARVTEATTTDRSFTIPLSGYQRSIQSVMQGAITDNTRDGKLLDAEGKPIFDANKIGPRQKELKIEALVPWVETNLLTPDKTAFRSQEAEAAANLGGPLVMEAVDRAQEDSAPIVGGRVLTEEEKAAKLAEEKKAKALKVRDTLEDQATTTMEPIIKDGKTTPDDEAKFIDSIVAKGMEGLDEEQLAAWKESVRSTYGPLFEEAREKSKLGKTPEGRFKLLNDTINTFKISDDVSTATIESIKEANDKVYLNYAGLGTGVPAQARDRVEADVIADKAEETLEKILKDGGFDPILVKRNSRPYYDKLLGNLETRYTQAVAKQRTTAEEAEKEKQRLNTLG